LLLLSFAIAQDDKDTDYSGDKADYEDYEDSGDKDTEDSVSITWT